MKISLIVAASTNNAIGKNNQLLWHLPKDMRFFKNTTWAMPVVMGRKTYESMGGKPLNGRLNIIITRNKSFEAAGVVVVDSIQSAIATAEKENYKEVFVIGGGEIYNEVLLIADRLYITRVHTEIEGDTFFPAIDTAMWRLTYHEAHIADAKHAYDFTFETWEK
ncbi:MAG: dihydrofolate reductase [Chitinophagaceae bacterium]|nr:dihydrofolate reductase [Chitinophagaceae bacterium]